jgi:hypothetical protein
MSGISRHSSEGNDALDGPMQRFNLHNAYRVELSGESLRKQTASA